jgi:hypoxanthine phosphoribosyltransferase
MTQEINYNQIVKVPEEGLPSPNGRSFDIPENYSLRERIDKVLIPEEIIKRRVRAMAQQIITDYSSVNQLYFISLLKGAFIFAADLGREINKLSGMEIKIDFYRAATYGMEIKKEGENKREVKILKRPTYIPGIEVLLIDDIADTVFTMTAIKKDLIEKLGVDPSKIKICFLLNKILKKPPEEVKKIKALLKPEYVGFDIPDVWIAGYGIDAGEDFRLLPSIVSVKEEYYVNR